MAPQQQDTQSAGTSTTASSIAEKSESVTKHKPIKNALNDEVEHFEFDHPELRSVFPTTKHDPIPVLPYEDRGLMADLTFKNLLKDASVTHLSPRIGTELSGIQLHQLTNAQRDELALLVSHRGVIFFREQEINIEQQLDLGRYYGPLHVHQNLGHPEGHPVVLVVENSVGDSDRIIKRQQYDPDNVWHSDVSNERQPPSYTSFKVLTNPPLGGGTLWASAYEAYERLTPPFKTFIEGLTAIHSSKAQAERAGRRGHTIRRAPVEFEHPVVRTHPVTGRKALFVNPAFTRRIPQLSSRESDAVLKVLYKHITEGHEFQVRFRWTKNAAAVWDNHITTHFATFDYLPGNRHAVRVTTQKEIPYLDGEASRP
ncbi:TfdA family Taurine catabolism dioxygenase TauD [Phytophthora infestans]|uniref:TfdA family Taurine catabolism dioxygenase TauD n=1 Tax=Phytophthora infestans TaxID=4787 RepID=A0A833SSD8_PHYIN|nr:TfdA family Taurine catabolism dioxygenase TauD [Phytophthora infestans]